MEQIITVVLADDHEIVRTGIKLLLENEGDIDVIGEASDGVEALERVQTLQPDILIIDIRMPNLNGIEATRQLQSLEVKTKVIVLSMHEDEEYILRSVECGASGYLLKDTNKAEFIKAIKSVFQGEKYFSGDISGVLINNYLNVRDKGTQATIDLIQNYNLTKREKQIYSLLYKGISNKDIADKLNKSVRTVETHRFNIMHKMGVNNVVELLRKVEDDPALKKSLLEMV
jgi:DNA-binding NarL/FixJ family response regulator